MRSRERERERQTERERGGDSVCVRENSRERERGIIRMQEKNIFSLRQQLFCIYVYQFILPDA